MSSVWDALSLQPGGGSEGKKIPSALHLAPWWQEFPHQAFIVFVLCLVSVSIFFSFKVLVLTS